MSGETPDALPDVHEGELDEATLDALVGDILRETRVLSVLTKGGAESLSEGATVALPDAVALLRAGRVRAVQVRYVFQGAHWTDTLLRGATGVRVVRIATPV